MNKKSIATILCLLGVAGFYWLAQAGPLEPPGPPASTGHTLEEIYDKADDCRGAGPYEVPKTGQTVSYGFADDGAYQTGVSVDPRFSFPDPENGTVKDNLTGLIWLKNAGCMGFADWTGALTAANGLSAGSVEGCELSDGSAPGDWRLPNVRELKSLFDYGENYPALPGGHLFENCQYKYWSSTTKAFGRSNAWTVVRDSGTMESVPKNTSNGPYIWPVREENLP